MRIHAHTLGMWYLGTQWTYLPYNFLAYIIIDRNGWNDGPRGVNAVEMAEYRQNWRVRASKEGKNKKADKFIPNSAIKWKITWYTAEILRCRHLKFSHLYTISQLQEGTNSYIAKVCQIKVQCYDKDNRKLRVHVNITWWDKKRDFK